MSAVFARSRGSSVTPQPAPPALSRGWIVNSWVDQALILLTPLIAAPALWVMHSPLLGIKAETIALIVTAFFATGHHLPGLIRAYGDRELFQRFRWRFLLAPPLVFLAYFPLHRYHYDLYRLIILVWATWHGLMQLYGFMRIYDAKVGSTSSTTAYWDWLACLCGFIVPQFFRAEKVSGTLQNWYSVGGPALPPWSLEAMRWSCLGVSGVVAIGYLVNYAVQMHLGKQPSSLKLLMLVSGIGMWWYAVVCIDNLLLGFALFDICHDVQYLAIVWLYNCRRVSTNPHLGGFMTYVFRRGMVLLYLGLITAYGALGLLGTELFDGPIRQLFYGILFTSTILHYYYDGFIWKVRETATRASLGVGQSTGPSQNNRSPENSYAHFLKWSPALLIGGLLFATDLLDPPMTYARKNELTDQYAGSLAGTTVLPKDDEERSWLLGQFQRTQNIAAAVPEDRQASLRAAIMLANFGRNDEAIQLLKQTLQRFPEFSDAYLTMGSIHLYRSNLGPADECLTAALNKSKTSTERAAALLKLGELDLERQDFSAANARFDEAVRENRQLESAVAALLAREKASAKPL